MVVQLRNADARSLAITAQGLAGRRHRDPLRLLGQLCAIQIDTISVIARSHELVAYSRLGPVSRQTLDRAWWGSGQAFEYWAHAACLVPVELWPLFAWRRRRYLLRYARTREQAELLARVRDLGAATIADLGGARTAPGWWEWSPVKRAVEQLLARGEVVCTERRGFRRVYRPAEAAVPDALLNADLDDAECFARLVSLAASRLGVATDDDIADHFRMPVAAVRPAAEAAGLVRAEVEGWGRRAWAAPGALGTARARLSHRPVLLSPFDSLIWHRPRTQRLFGFRHRLEAYTPSAHREHGYFVMPLLAGRGLRGRVDPKREGTTLVARRVSLEPAALEPMAGALVTAARWVGCDAVRVDDVTPAELGGRLRAALASSTGEARSAAPPPSAPHSGS